MTINCSNPVTVDEGDDVICECKGEEGNLPDDVIWYDKNNNRIGKKEKGKKILFLRNVKRENSGTYKCKAQSHTLTDEGSLKTDEGSLKIIVNCKYAIYNRSPSLSYREGGK